MAYDRDDPRKSEATPTPEEAPTLAPSGDVQAHRRIGPYRLLDKRGAGGTDTRHSVIEMPPTVEHFDVPDAVR